MKKYKLVKEKNEKIVKFTKRTINSSKQVVLAIGVVIIFALSLSSCKKNTNQTATEQHSVTVILGEEEYSKTSELSAEVSDYLNISKELNKFMKENRIMGISEKELSDEAEKVDLKPANVLSKEIEEIKKLIKNSEVSRAELFDKIKNLMIQEKKVNKYLYNSYYDVNKILETSLKAYVGEKYGILDLEKIIFSNYDNTICYGNESVYDFKIAGEISFLEKLTTINDPNQDDNDKYNKDRNKILKDGLKYAEKLFETVNEKNLYSKHKARKLR